MRPQRATHGTIYAEGHAVAFMALLARAGGSVTIARNELTAVQGTIYRTVNPDGTITYRLDREDV